MKKLMICLALLFTSCKTDQVATTKGEQTYNCQVDDNGQVICVPAWEFKKAPQRKANKGIWI